MNDRPGNQNEPVATVRPASVGRRLLFLLGLSMIGFTPASNAAAQDTEAPASPAVPIAEPEIQAEPAPPAPTLVVRDLSVFLLDRFGNLANAQGDYDSTLFNGTYRRRRPATNNPLGPTMPLGLITLQGEVTTPRRLQLNTPQTDEGVQFLGYWPKTQAKPRAIDWHDIRPIQGNLSTADIPVGHYLRPLFRAEDRIGFTTRGNTGRFFVYDLPLKIEPPLSLNRNASGQLELIVEKPAGGLTLLIRKTGQGVALGQLTSTQVEMGHLDPAQHGSHHTIQFKAIPPDTDPLAPLETLLVELGYNAAERGVALATVRDRSLSTLGVTAVCVMNRGVLDTVLPLTMDPPADRIERVAIVVLTNIDPDLSETVSRYIAQLGDDDWAVRDAAMRTLIEIGRAGIETVQQSRNHDDPEVAYRIEQVLDAYELKYGELSEVQPSDESRHERF